MRIAPKLSDGWPPARYNDVMLAIVLRARSDGETSGDYDAQLTNTRNS